MGPRYEDSDFSPPGQPPVAKLPHRSLWDVSVCASLAFQFLMKKKIKGVNQERIEGASSQNWHENGNDYLPFLKYMLGIVVGLRSEVPFPQSGA